MPRSSAIYVELILIIYAQEFQEPLLERAGRAKSARCLELL
jgi:hypothetical protein